MATIVDQETDARFWAQTNYKPGQKLDTKDPTDAKMIPVWVDIHAKVKREFDAGTLRTTFDHPVVAQNLADAHVADKAAAAHLDAAAKTPDPAAAQQHVDAAHIALEIGAAKVQEAAAVQPTTASPQLTHEAAQQAKQEPPPPSAPARDHIAHAQAQAAHKPLPRGILEKETDARFWAQTHYKPNQKLDPKDSKDAKMIPVWVDIYGKVKREDDAGKLVLTYNHPVVAQNLADAHVADQVAAEHLDAAAADPQTAQQNVAAAAAAAQVSAQKARAAAQLQPPTVSPQLAHEAAHKSDEQTLINQETDVRFWTQTLYKPRQRLDPRNPQDAQMIPVWMSIHAQVTREHLAREVAQKPPTGRDHLAQEQAKGAGRKAAGVHHDHRHRRPVRSTVPPGKIKDLQAQAAQLAHSAGGQFVIVLQRPDGTPEHRTFGSRAELETEYTKISDQHDQYKYVAAFDLTADSNAPVHESVGIPAAEHADVPAPAPTPSAPSEVAPTPPSEEKPAAEEKPGWSTGKKIAVAAVAIAAVTGIVYAVTRKSSLTPSLPSARTGTGTPKVIVAMPSRPRTSKVFVASPTPAPTRALKA